MTKRAPPHLMCQYDLPTVTSIQAMALGEATPQQQKDALNWIVNQAAATYEMAFQEGSSEATNFYLGRMFVGQQIVKLTKLSGRTLAQKGTKHE